MEIEYKWNLPDEQTLIHILDDVANSRGIVDTTLFSMHAIYYDTVAGDVRRMHGGLRMRRENDDNICCLKLSACAQDACKTREEYQVAAKDILDGLRHLPDVGAPQDVCELLLAGNPVVICETEFVREARQVETDDFVAELAVDRGEMRRGGKSAPINEVELEFKSGSMEAFHRFAAELQQTYPLAVQPLSKLARAMAL